MCDVVFLLFRVYKIYFFTDVNVLTIEYFSIMKNQGFNKPYIFHSGSTSI